MPISIYDELPSCRKELDVQLRVIDSEHEFFQLADRWKRLATTSAHTPFQTFEWNWAWWRLVGSKQLGLRLAIVIAEQGTHLLAVMPLMYSNLAGQITARILTAPYADYHEILTDVSIRPGIYVTLLSFIVQQLSTRWDVVELEELPHLSPFGQFLKQQPHIQANLVSSLGSLCPVLDLSVPGELERCLSIKEYCRKERRLSKAGRLCCIHHIDARDIAARMDDYMAMHRYQWLPRKNCGITFVDETIIRFYRGLIDYLAPAHILQLTELILDGTPIAFYYGFRYKQTFWGYRPTYETKWKRLSPGHILHRFMFRELPSIGASVFDFMRGSFDYKMLYATRAARNLTFSISRFSR